MIHPYVAQLGLASSLLTTIRLGWKCLAVKNTKVFHNGSSICEIATKEKMNRIELDNKRDWWDEIVFENLVFNRS
jgi:hypothetical protein